MYKIICPFVFFLAVIFFSAGSASGAEKEGEIRISGEILPWSLSAAAFGLSLVLDNTDPWPSDPLIGGDTDHRYHENTVEGYWLFAGVGAMTGFIALVPNRDGFLNRTSYVNVKGYIQAVAFTSLFTGITKNAFGRRRPSYDNYPSGEKERDGRKSFISGHASSSFCTATYGSLFIWYHVGRERGPWQTTGRIAAAAGLHSLAAWVAWTRVNDNRHNVSDVVAGGCAGSAAALFTFLWHNGNLKPGDTVLSVFPVSTGEMNGLAVSRSL